MPLTPEEYALLSDPSTSPETLARLAYAAPEMWPAIAAHPNVYPALVDWARQNGLEAVPAPVEAVPVEPEPVVAAPEVLVVAEVPVVAVSDEAVLPEVPAAGFEEPAFVPMEPVMASGESLAEAPPVVKAPSVRSKRRVKLKVIIAAAAVIVVIAAVGIPVYVMQQRAAEEAAAAELAAKREFDGAVARYKRAEDACKSANARLSDQLAVADRQLQIAPATIDDKKLLPAVEQAAEIGRGTTPCVSKSMPSGVEAIKAQADSTMAESQTVDAAAEQLQVANAAVDKYFADIKAAEDKKAAEKKAAEDKKAAEKKAAEEAAAKAKRTWKFKDSQGYTFEVVVDVGNPTTSFSSRNQKLGDACSFDPARDIAVPVKLSVKATTKGFDTKIDFRYRVTAENSFTRVRSFAIEGYYSSKADCSSVSYRTARSGVVWEEPWSTGQTGTHDFVVIIRDWKTPDSPNGDTKALAQIWVALENASGSRGVYLNNKPVG